MQHRSSVEGRGLVGCGKLPPQRVVGGWNPPCFFIRYDAAVAISPPDYSDVFIGDEVRILAASSSSSVGGIRCFDVKLGNVPQLVLTGSNRKDMVQWLADNFTDAEIDAMAAEYFDTDSDGDTISDAEEFFRGTNPRVGETGAARRDTLSAVGTGGDGLPHFQFSYVLGDVQDVSTTLSTTEDLAAKWNSDPDQFELIEVNPQPDGSTEYVWELTEPISSDGPTKQYVHRGHVTVLK
jgi:hypothetical protein